MKLIECICVGTILLAPLLFKLPTGNKISNDTNKGIVNNFTLIITDVNKSNSGFTNCIGTIKDIDKVVITPCTTTEGMPLRVGTTYKVSRATINKDLLSVNEAESISTGVKLKVIEVGVRARVSIAILENGRIIGNNNGLRVGEYVYVD